MRNICGIPALWQYLHSAFLREHTRLFQRAPPTHTHTQLHAPPPPAWFDSLDVDKDIFCVQVTKTQRMSACVWLCAAVRAVTGCQERATESEREREREIDSRTETQHCKHYQIRVWCWVEFGHACVCVFMCLHHNSSTGRKCYLSNVRKTQEARAACLEFRRFLTPVTRPEEQRTISGTEFP